MATTQKKRRGSATYSYRPGHRVRGVKPAVAGRELERIRREYQALTPNVVVQDAEPESSPLHPVFEWDDTKAAHEHRLLQARNLIRSVCVVYSESQEPRQQYVHVRINEEAGYHPVSAVVRNPDMLAAATAELRAKLASARNSVRELQEQAEAIGDNRRASAMNVVGRHVDAAQDAADGTD